MDPVEAGIHGGTVGEGEGGGAPSTTLVAVWVQVTSVIASVRVVIINSLFGFDIL